MYVCSSEIKMHLETWDLITVFYKNNLQFNLRDMYLCSSEIKLLLETWALITACLPEETISCYSYDTHSLLRFGFQNNLYTDLHVPYKVI